MTDALTADADPKQIQQHLAQLFAEPKLSSYVVAAGLRMVSQELARLHDALASSETNTEQIVETIAHLADEVRRGQRKHLGAVAQAQKERAAAELLWQVLLGVTIHQPQLVAERLTSAVERDPYLVQLAHTADEARQTVLVRSSNAYQAMAQQVRAELGDCLLAASEAAGATARAQP
ncbi:hypothetical protein [Streptacidiphilus sp. MAP5-3]|uniref:hypothetical protein n=1 Tax=unclassified Streptacidiphilus TaxID=2643834 RepID=UPI003518178D